MNKFILVVMLVGTIFPWVSIAHGTDTTFTQKSGDYTLEFEYSGVNNLKAGNLALLDVYLLDGKEEAVDFDSVFVKISDGKNSPVFYGTFKEAADIKGTARMGTIVKDPGNYKVQVQFNKAGQVLSADYDLVVDPGLGSVETKNQLPSGTATIVLEVILVVGGFVLGFASRSVLNLKKN